MLGDKTNLRAGVGDTVDTRSARIGLNPKAKLAKNMTTVALLIIIFCKKTVFPFSHESID